MTSPAPLRAMVFAGNAEARSSKSTPHPARSVMAPMFLFGAASVLVCGCRFPEYVAPASGATAEITFDSKDRGNLSSTNEDYLNFAIGKECLGGKRGYVKVPPMSSKTVTVRAEKPLYVSLSTLANGSGGTLYFSFIPHKAEHYAVTYQVLPGPSGRDSMDIKAFDSQEQPVKLSIGTGAWPRCNNK